MLKAFNVMANKNEAKTIENIFLVIANANPIVQQVME